MKHLRQLLFAILLLTCMSMMHPYYVGVTEINWVTAKKFDVSLKLITDDLQTAIYKSQKVKYKSTVKSAANQTALMKYILGNFNIQVSSLKKNRNVPLKFIGWEIEEEATWIYLESETAAEFKKETRILVANKLLYNVLDKQVQIVHCNRNGVRKSDQVIQPDFQISFEY